MKKSNNNKKEILFPVISKENKKYSPEELENISFLILIAEYWVDERFDELWLEIEKVWGTDAKEKSYVPLSYMFKGRLNNIIERDFDTILWLKKQFSIEGESFIIGCLNYRGENEIKFSLVKKEVKKRIDEIFLIPDNLVFAYQRREWELIPMIMETNQNKNLMKIDIEETFNKLLRKTKNEIIKTTNGTKNVTKLDLFKQLKKNYQLPMEQATFYDRVKKINIDEL